MTDEQIAQIQEAFQQFARACEQVWDAIVDAVAPIVRAVIRWYRQRCAAYLIPRQYRLTMARRKVRRYALFCARRA